MGLLVLLSSVVSVAKLVCAQSKLGSLSFLNHIDRDTPDGVAQLPLGLIISAVTPLAACVPLAHAAGGVAAVLGMAHAICC